MSFEDSLLIKIYRSAQIHKRRCDVDSEDDKGDKVNKARQQQSSENTEENRGIGAMVVIGALLFVYRSPAQR